MVCPLIFEAKSRDPNLTDEQRQVYRDQAITLQDQAQAINKDWGAGSPYRQVATALVAAASGNVTGANGEFVRSMVVNYVQQQGAGYIGDLVGKGELTEGSPIHAALHAIVGCAGAAASQQNCSAGALGGAASSVLAGLFDETSPDETAEQREAKRNIITSLVTGIAALRDPGDATTASGAATANVDNNWLATQQKVQRDKELAQAASPLDQLAVHAKWSRVDLGQDVDTGVGIAKGLKDGLAGTGLETLNGFANFMRDPVEQWNNLAKLASTDAIKQALGDGYEAFQAEVQLVQKQLETGGGHNAEALGHRMGSIIGIVLGTVSTGGASTARAGQVLSEIGIVVRSSKAAQVIAGSKGKTLTYLERLKQDGRDSDVPEIPATPTRIDYARDFERDLSNFKPGYQLINGPLDDDLVLVSFHADMPLGQGRSAKWWTSTDQGNKMVTIDDVHQALALPPEWGSREAVTIIRIPKGTEITAYKGNASSQLSEAGELFNGDGLQYRFKDFDPSWILETREIPK